MILYHGSREIVEYPEIRKARFNKDFYFGFYCTQYEEQAKRWASRYGEIGYLNKYEYVPNHSLTYLVFEKMTEEWLDFVISCRSGISHTYDIVEDFPHCAIFPTAASRRSLGRVSVPMWPVALSGRLLIVALVGRHPANWLIRRGSISYHRSFSHRAMRLCGLMRY